MPRLFSRCITIEEFGVFSTLKVADVGLLALTFLSSFFLLSSFSGLESKEFFVLLLLLLFVRVAAKDDMSFSDFGSVFVVVLNVLVDSLVVFKVSTRLYLPSNCLRDAKALAFRLIVMYVTGRLNGVNNMQNEECRECAV